VREWLLAVVVVAAIGGCLALYVEVAPLGGSLDGTTPIRKQKSFLAEKAEQVVDGLDWNQRGEIGVWIHSHHNQINGLLGHGRIASFGGKNYHGWESIYRMYTDGDNFDQVLAIEEDASTESVRQDLQAFMLALKLAFEERNVRYLKLAHRIIHDLDYWVFRNCGEAYSDEKTKISQDYWGVTITLEGLEAPAAILLETHGQPE